MYHKHVHEEVLYSMCMWQEHTRMFIHCSHRQDSNTHLHTILSCIAENITNLSIYTTGAMELSSSPSEASSGPLFLSSLHCTEEDQSLLDDCYHDLLGLAVCDGNFGLARAKCFGKSYSLQLLD